MGKKVILYLFQLYGWTVIIFLCSYRFSWLYVAAAVTICLLVGGLLFLFLFPRNVSLSSNMEHIIPDAFYSNLTEPAYLILFIGVSLHILL